MTQLQDLRGMARGMSVLFVDDIESIRSSVSSSLRLIFDTVYTASDGEEGLDIFYKQTPDIVVADIEMPRLNGLEMIREMRKAVPNLPTIITTAYDDNHFLVEAIELGVDRFIVKPIKNEQFLEALFYVISNLRNRNIVETLKKELDEKKSETYYDSALEQFIAQMPIPAAIFRQGRLFALNSGLRELFCDTQIHELMDGKKTPDDFLLDKKHEKYNEHRECISGTIKSAKIQNGEIKLYILKFKEPQVQQVLMIACP